MSKEINSLSVFFVSIWLILQFFTICGANSPFSRANQASENSHEVKIRLGSEEVPRVIIEGRFPKTHAARGKKVISFIKAKAGFGGLAERITGLEAADEAGRKVDLKKLQDGEFLARDEITFWRYSVDLTPLKNAGASAHVSWVKDDTGVLMLEDLLPILSGGSGDADSALVQLDLPAGWTAFSVEKQIGASAFEINSITDAVIVIGKKLRVVDIAMSSKRVVGKIVLTSEWLFTDSNAREISEQIFQHYQDIFGRGLAKPVLVSILPFPVQVPKGNWEAETRGSTITVISSDMPFRTQSLQRLHEQLRHEIFHLWFPNSLNLTGEYGWFYEGFALYASLKTGVAVNRIGFGDFLDTISRAAEIDKRMTKRRSLIEESVGRWQGDGTAIYARGMLAAFVIDLAMLEDSRGKRSVEDIFRMLLTEFAESETPIDGNKAVISVLQKRPELGEIINRFIHGSEKIAVEKYAVYAGIGYFDQKRPGSLTVSARPGSKQRSLLNKLGYNNWKKAPKYQNAN